MTRSKNKKLSSKLLSPETTIIASILIVVLPTPILFYTWLRFGDFTLMSVQPTLSQQILGFILKPLIILAPFTSIYLALKFYHRREKAYREALSKLASSQQQKIRAESQRRYLLYLITFGVVLGSIAMWLAWPKVTQSYQDYRYSQKHTAAIQRGCVQYKAHKLAEGDPLVKNHELIIRYWDFDYSHEAIVTAARKNIDASFERCLEEEITPSEQEYIVDEYRQLIETRAHKLLRENPHDLPENEIERIRQLEKKYHP